MFSVSGDTKLHSEYQDISQNVVFNMNDFTNGNELTGMGDDDDKLADYDASLNNITDISSNNVDFNK